MAWSWAVQATYDAWKRIVDRLENPRNKDYRNYGGRGLTICPEWRASFKVFLRDVGPKPARDRLLWLGLSDLAKDYAPGNVAWLKHQRQISHRRYCHRINLDGKALTIQEAGRQIGMPPMTLRQRLLEQKLCLARAATPGRVPFRIDSKRLTFNGRTLSLPEWARELGIPVRTLRERVRRGDPEPLTPGLRRIGRRPKSPSRGPSGY